MSLWPVKTGALSYGGEGNLPIKGHLRFKLSCFVVWLYKYIYAVPDREGYFVTLANFYIYLYNSYMYFSGGNNRYI